MNIIIAGGKHAGKTTAANKLAQKMKENGTTISGFLCPEDKITNLATGESRQFLYKEPQEDAQTIGPYWIPKEAIAFGAAAASTPAEHTFIDEYGKLELHMRGFHSLLKEAWKKSNCIILIRDVNVEPFKERFGTCKTYLLTAQNRDTLPDHIYKEVMEKANL